MDDGTLPRGTGWTDEFGNITVSREGSPFHRAVGLFHEKVHSWLSPSSNSLFARQRGALVEYLYGNSHFFRYTEEMLAESFGQIMAREFRAGSYSTGQLLKLAHQRSWKYYDISGTRLLLETTGGAGVIGGLWWSAYAFGDWAWGPNE